MKNTKTFKRDDLTIYNRRGFNCYGIHRNGTLYDRDGYNYDGYDRMGRHRSCMGCHAYD